MMQIHYHFLRENLVPTDFLCSVSADFFVSAVAQIIDIAKKMASSSTESSSSA
jgi:hypothetical protein